jgi:hypothetical protein
LWLPRSQVTSAASQAPSITIGSGGITKASPAVVTYTGTDPANGDYVVMTVNGMYQMNGRVVRVANVNTGSNTFEAEGVDSTLYDTCTSGSAQVITFGTTLDTLRNPSPNQPEIKFEDITTIHDSEDQQIPVGATAGSFNFEAVWDGANAGNVAMRAAFIARTERAFKFVFANGKIFVFNGYVGAASMPGGSGIATFSVSIAMKKLGTEYAS